MWPYKTSKYNYVSHVFPYSNHGPLGVKSMSTVEAACIAFHCSCPIYISLTMGLSAILPKHGCHFKQLLISAKVLNILILLLLTCEEVLHAPIVQI